MSQKSTSPESLKKKEEKSLLGTFFGIFEEEKLQINKSDISSPFNAVHLTHVMYNDERNEFQGLPSEWEVLLRESGITKQDQKSNPQAVIDVMSFYSENQKRQMDDIFLKINPKFMPPKKPPRSISKEDLTLVNPPVVPPRPSFTIKKSNVADKSAIYEKLAPELKKPPRSGSVESLTAGPSVVQTPKLPPKPKTPPKIEESPPAVRPRKKGLNLDQVMESLKKISTEIDPLTKYSNLVKIGQGASGGVFSASSNIGELVALKQINLGNQPKKELIINEIIVMKDSKHKNIVNYIDSFLWQGDLWVIYSF
jgi:p21-activated kinase 1